MTILELNQMCEDRYKRLEVYANLLGRSDNYIVMEDAYNDNFESDIQVISWAFDNNGN